MTKEQKVVWIAAIIQFVNIVDFMMVMPLGPDIAKSLPVSNADIGVICGCYTLAVGLSGILCSKFLDNFDRKKVAVLAVLGLSIGTVSAAFAGDLNTLIAARVFAGLFGGPAAAIALSMIADIVPPKRRGKAMAIVMGTFSVSSIVAIPFGLELARLGSWKTPFYGIFFLGCFALLLILLWTPSMKGHLTSANKPVSFIQLIQKSKYNYAYVMMLTAMVATYAIIPPLSAYLQLNLGYPRESLGLLYLAGGIFTLILTQVAGRLSDRIGAVPTNIIGTALFVVFLYDGFMHQPISSVSVIFCMFMGTGLFRNVSAMTEASKLPIPQERAGFMSLLSSIQHIGNGVGAFVASIILTTGVNGHLVNMEWVVAISIAFALIQPLCLVAIKRKSTTETMPELDELKIR